MALAHLTAKRSSCSRRQVGAVLVRDRIPLMQAYNGTPMGAINCDDGGCPRCASDEPSYSGYGWCLCVHAEVNAVALAAHEGIAVRGATLYCTLRPCLDCLKAVVQAGIRTIYYAETFDYPEHIESAYWGLAQQVGVVLALLPGEGESYV